MDKQALQVELVKLNQQMSLVKPSHYNPNAPRNNTYFELVAKKNEIISQLKAK